MIKRVAFIWAFTCAFTLVLSFTQLLNAAETNYSYVSDVLTVPLRSGPSNAHRIVHRGLPSGTALEVLETDEESGFTHIRTQRGTDGWVRSQYIVNEPIARMQLQAAIAEAARLRREMSNQNKTLGDLRQARQQQSTDQSASDTEVKSLELELSEIKQISAGALSEHAENQKLNALNSRLRTELTELQEENVQLIDNNEQRWLLIGAGLILLGLLAGVALKARPRRSGWS